MPGGNVISKEPEITICVLTFGEHPALARQVLGSIQAHCPRSRYRMVVGANAVGDATARLLREYHQAGHIDHLISSPTNLNKCPMMRLMFERVDTEFIWWFDDDSYITSSSALGK
ncbi:MAG: glycosyltransferase [Pedosphaera sp.]|nr:glycosyltransferase [Pedosphaera sp.]